MNRFSFVLVVILLSSSFLMAQSMNAFNDENENYFNGGFGMTWIDGTAYTTFTLTPEFSFGKFGVGLNIELLFNNSEGFKFRKTGWDKGAGALRMIRYISWGHKTDPVYTRIGTLDGAILGHGFIMGYYTNQANYDYRKIGMALDIDFKKFGFESVTSNLGNLEILGGRFYYRPLAASGIPILKNFEMGATYIGDFNPDNRKSTHDAITEWGLDVGLPIIKNKLITTTIYADYAKINNHGDGKAVGIMAYIPNVIGVFGIYAKLERRFLSAGFLPNYFNSLYELERNALPADYYGIDDPTRSVLTKAQYLDYVEATQGIFGELAGQILGKIRLVGNYQQNENVKNSGILHLEARSRDLVPNFELKYTYDKVGIGEFGDVFTLDYRSVAQAIIGYRTFKYLLVSMVYRWNFIYDEETGEYKPIERVMPQVSFSMPF
ncbi:hypothetical protein Calab_2340 [Caldithrix abyssi DSM 13497]|uniref:Uncharacterized protein n=1 Tax=Caldithrix abyssi DSM 13497 TaxID=880073 RepID=H1XXG5_CALAY|nr:hypothetical protein [Caldithrix abyssi]APF17890.1 hypothetical protein Cabys_1141 [Caldithrix abyssi DSM 13497]EHO41950.1 hypothetical protein Calab_2340 [Caldithrix abyssi DSM 13497]